MSLKLKLTSTIAAFMLILGLTIMGVFAAPTATIQLGGSLNFKATDVHAKVTGVIAGTKVDPQPTLTDLVFESGVNTDVSSWANVPLEFTDAGSEITITVTIENLATDRPLYATLEDAVGEVTNVTKSMKKGSDAYTGDVIELPASTGTGTSTAVITLSMKVTDPNASIADDATYGYSIELNNEEPEVSPAVEMKYDAEKNYYYIEMGTYNGNPVRWRYVSDVTSGIDTATRFAPTAENKPNTSAGRKGMFILESDIFTVSDINATEEINDDGVLPYLSETVSRDSEYYNKAEGYTDVLAIDYAASDLRAYLNGTTNVANKDVGSIFETINLDTNNAIYAKIQKRSLTDLYASKGDGGETELVPTQFNSIKDIPTDAFWALSNQEAIRILGGGESNQNEICWESPAYREYALGAPEEFARGMYYLRSWSGDAGHSGTMLGVNDGGNTGTYGGVQDKNKAARPAFILNF